MFQNRRDLLIYGVNDQIHQRRRYALLPAMGSVLQTLNEHRACLGAFVSGAGPAIAAFTTEDGNRLGEIAVAEFRNASIDAEYRILVPDYIGMTY